MRALECSDDDDGGGGGDGDDDDGGGGAEIRIDSSTTLTVVLTVFTKQTHDSGMFLWRKAASAYSGPTSGLKNKRKKTTVHNVNVSAYYCFGVAAVAFPR